MGAVDVGRLARRAKKKLISRSIQLEEIPYKSEKTE